MRFYTTKMALGCEKEAVRLLFSCRHGQAVRYEARGKATRIRCVYSCIFSNRMVLGAMGEIRLETK